MKMRKKLAAVLAAAMIASVMPMTAFAASRNRVDKTVTVEKDSAVKEGQEPELRIKLDDKLTTTQSFYLNLTGSEWLSTADLIARFGKDKAAQKTKNVDGVVTDVKDVFNFVVKGDEHNNDKIFEAHRENDKTLAIRYVQQGTVKDGTTTVNGTETGNGVSSVITPNANPNYNFEFIFPMAATIKDAEAKVAVQMYDTTISNTEHVFAISDKHKATVKVAGAPGFYRSTEIANITLEETYANSLKDVKNADERWFTLELRDTDFTFNVTSDAKLVGERAYRNGPDQKLENVKNYTLSADRTRLGIKIENDILNSSLQERGNIVLKGVEVVADRDARDGDVQVVIDSKKLFDKETITVAKRGDYKTKLSVPTDWKEEVVAGTEKEVEFILSEELANSLIGTRPVTFTFDQGVRIKSDAASTSYTWRDYEADGILWSDYTSDQTKAIKDLLTEIDKLEAKKIDKSATPTELADLSTAKADLIDLLGFNSTNTGYKRPGSSVISAEGIVKINGSDVDAPDKDDWADTEIKNRVHIANDYKSFTVDNFNLDKNKAGKYTFKTTLLIPAGVTGDITVEATGKGISEDKITILKAEAPVTVEATTMDIKVGLKEIETTGKITIKETKEERIAQGKNIVLAIDQQDSGLKIKSFKATVVEGDLVLGDRKDTNTNIEVKRVSTKPSTIEITDIVMYTDRTVPEGKYNLLVGGNATSDITGKKEFSKEDHYMIDPVAVVKDFINITTKNTEDLQGSANKAEVKFVVGADQFLVNGKEETMDAPAYIKDGNTMVSVRYVSTALGVDADKVIWDQANQTATILADKVVQVKLGSKSMNVNGVSIPMNVAAELTNDRTFVPMGAIARALGVNVVWDNETKTATFNPAADK